jgi:hypothetical protein
MTYRLRFPTLFDALFVGAPMQDSPVRVAIATAIASVAGVAAVLAL